MDKNRFDILKKLFIIVLVILIITLVNSAILFFWIGWFFIVGAIVIFSGLFSILCNFLPFVGQIMGGLFKNVNSITVRYKWAIYIGYGITLFLQFGLKINLIKLILSVL